MKGRGSKTGFKLEAVDDPDPIDTLLKASADMLRGTSNPYYVWRAIEICITHKKDFPEWVIAYFSECVKRMKSDKAKKARDLREVLPWVFGFHAKKRGPGKLLYPAGSSRAGLLFPLKFAIWLEKGEEPVQAMHRACNEVFDEETADKVDDKTLRRWLLKDFGLKAWPRHAAEWKKIAKPYLDLAWKGEIPRSYVKLLEDFADKVSRNPVVTL
jgi:hypothetical protein